MVNDAATATLASMTGYAARDGRADGLSWSWEIRSVNGRGLDVRLRLPEGLGALDAPLRKAVSARIARGSVTINLRVASDGAAQALRVDPAALEAALAALSQIQRAAAAQGLVLPAPTAAEVFSLKGVTDAAAVAVLPDPAVLLTDFDAVLDAFAAMRREEGAALKSVLAGQLDRVATLVSAARDAALARGDTQAARLKANLHALLDETAALDLDRLAQEAALLLVKSDVMEEIDRLTAHAAAARGLLAKGGQVGRKLDFLMQEFNREANTLCSKSGDTGLTAIGLDLKLAIDQMREQVQNLE